MLGNNILFEKRLLMGGAMGMKLAPPHANLCVGFFEETILFLLKLRNIFSYDNCKLINDYSKDIQMTVFPPKTFHIGS